MNEKKGWKLYNEGLRNYYSRNFANTLKYMQAAERYIQGDSLVQLYATRAAEFKETPPADDWDGIVTITEK